uniref:Acetoacetate decarboxylase n=1 Tax=Cyanothece sp. (strain PCC 7425 / ATCC 29141) TaxID=395961 RepID=B8HM81_CYAP4
MTYPSPPWTLRGSAWLCLHWLEVERVRALIPPALDILQFGGKTLGGVYLARYGEGSALSYHELIVVAGLVQPGGTVGHKHPLAIGSWISHIYVDLPDSVAGGREIWGLPKELAVFDWSAEQIQVFQGDHLLCRFQPDRPWWLWRQSLPTVQTFSQKPLDSADAQFIRFAIAGSSQWGLSQGRLTVPPESNLASLALGPPWLTLGLNHLEFTVMPPSLLG